MSSGAAMAAFFMGLGAVSPSVAQSGQSLEATVAAERMLGSDDEAARTQALLPYTRSLGARGVVAGSLMDSAAAAGVPRAAMLDVVRALDGESPPHRPQDGDTFYVRWQQTYTVAGIPIGVGRVLWLEFTTAAGTTIALHRFRPREGGEQFFLADGEAATPPALALPLDDITVSSPFGARPDPLSSRRRGMGPLPTPVARRQAAGSIVSAAKKRAGVPAGAHTARAYAGFGPRLFMHEGVDFAVPRGTPIHAAADGVVKDARRNGGYGNYVRVEHDDGVATAYGHLSRFAPGLKPGRKVVRGQLLGYSGNTGRSTGPHLHFEVLSDGKPVDPLVHAAIAQLGGIDYEHFSQLVMERERVRESEARVSE
jgi:murein DD-endopeptidase MepM/ murein hydrolase activator NlpD